MRWTATLLACFIVAGTASAQDKPHVYRNAQLGVDFGGVFGWKYEKFERAGAWTLLATYFEDAFKARVNLLVRTNPFESPSEMKEALQKEFSTDGHTLESTGEATLRKGTKLFGIRQEVLQNQVDKDGKKREFRLVVATFYGTNRLYRIYCSCPRIRYRKLQDRFESALRSLQINDQTEKTIVGIPFQSGPGRYACTVPAGFTIYQGARADRIFFRDRRARLNFTVFSYRMNEDNEYHLETMRDFYGDDLVVVKEEDKVLGAAGFRATLKKSSKRDPTVIVGTLAKGRAFRIHLSHPEGKEKEAWALVEQLLKTVRMR